jgi:hypothetical protein
VNLQSSILNKLLSVSGVPDLFIPSDLKGRGIGIDLLLAAIATCPLFAG